MQASRLLANRKLPVKNELAICRRQRAYAIQEPLRATTQLSWTAYNVRVGTTLAEGIGDGTDKRSHQGSSGLSCRTPWSGLARLMGACRRIGSAGRPLPPFSVKYQTGMFDATSPSSKLLTRTCGECESPRRCAMRRQRRAHPGKEAQAQPRQRQHLCTHD